MDAFLCDAVRTPIGRYGGALAGVRADDLAALPLRALMERHPGLDWSALDDVVLPDGRHFARAAMTILGKGDLVVAGPATVLDSWFPGARDACAPSRLLRLETGP